MFQAQIKIILSLKQFQSGLDIQLWLEHVFGSYPLIQAQKEVFEFKMLRVLHTSNAYYDFVSWRVRNQNGLSVIHHAFNKLELCARGNLPIALDQSMINGALISQLTFDFCSFHLPIRFPSIRKNFSKFSKFSSSNYSLYGQK